MAEKKFRRRQVVVDRRFQVGTALKIAIWLGYYILVFCIIAVGAEVLMGLIGGQPPEMVQAAALDMWAQCRALLLPFVLTAICLVLHTITMLHKIAGPVFRFKRVLGGIRQGDIYESIHLRDRDELKDLAAAYNDAMGHLRTDIVRLQDASEALSAGLERLDAGDATALERVKARSAEIAGVLGSYRTVRPADPADQPAPARESEPATA